MHAHRKKNCLLPADAPQQEQQQQQQQQQQQELLSNADIAAHRTAEFIVLLPAGATDLRMQLRRPAFIFGTAFQPETAPDPQWYQDTTASMFWGERLRLMHISLASHLLQASTAQKTRLCSCPAK
jgi:hypothetical protein